MADTPQEIFVSCLEDQICVRVVGRVTFQDSQLLQQFASEMIEQGKKEFVIDLGQCQGMDSTFLGVLAGIGLRLREIGRTAALQIVNISGRQMELLRTLGLDRLFNIKAGAGPLPNSDKFHPLPDGNAAQRAHPFTKDEAASLILEAHENLIRADERNARQFKELVKSLREAVKRARARGESKRRERRRHPTKPGPDASNCMEEGYRE